VLLIYLAIYYLLSEPNGAAFHPLHLQLRIVYGVVILENPQHYPNDYQKISSGIALQSVVESFDFVSGQFFLLRVN
jgi:hypothetical protein